MKYYAIKTMKARANKNGINSVIFISIFVENCLKYNAIHDLDF